MQSQAKEGREREEQKNEERVGREKAKANDFSPGREDIRQREREKRMNVEKREAKERKKEKPGDTRERERDGLRLKRGKGEKGSPADQQ